VREPNSPPLRNFVLRILPCPDIATASALAGAALLAALALRGLPWSAGSASPQTPFTHSSTPFLEPAFVLLRDADARIPRGASAVLLAGPRDARLESHFYRLGLALLPEREVLPGALFDQFTPAGTWAAAEYRIVVGSSPAEEEGTLVLRTPRGSIWRRSKR
jgi:hypothetical protein